NPTQEESSEDRDALGGRARDQARLRVELEHEAGAERVIEPAHEAVADELVLGSEPAHRELGGPVQVDTARREETIVARVEHQAPPEARREAVVEEVSEREAVEDAPRRRGAEQGRVGLRGDRVELAGVGERHRELGLEDRVAEAERAALAPLGEVRVDAELIVQIHVGAEAAVEEVRLVEAKIDELANAAELRLEREALPVSEQVGLLHLSGGDEVLEAREASADLE